MKNSCTFCYSFKPFLYERHLKMKAAFDFGNGLCRGQILRPSIEIRSGSVSGVSECEAAAFSHVTDTFGTILLQGIKLLPM
jgi:hypothetical protein